MIFRIMWHFLKLLGWARYVCLNLNVLKIYSSFLKVTNIYSNFQIRETFTETWLLSLTYLFATHSLWYFIPIFTKKFRMISNKIVGCDGLITFWKKPRYPSFIPSLQPIITWLSKFFRNKIIISKWGSFDKPLFQSGQVLFQSGAETVFSKWGSYFKVGKKLFQSSAVTSKWGKILFQSGAIILKWA